MDIQTQLSKVGVFDYELNRQSATKRLLKDYKQDDYVWYLDDEGLRFARSFGRYKQTLSKASKKINGYNPFKAEFGFDIHQVDGPSIQYSSLVITKHAIERWEQRARQMFPPHAKFHDMDELLATKGLLEGMAVIKYNEPLDIFFPFGEGAFIGTITMSDPSIYTTSISHSKRYACVANYSYDKQQRRWVGEFVPRASNKVIKTYLGWDELKQGGTFNSIDWYRQNFEWQQLPSEWSAKMREMGIDW